MLPVLLSPERFWLTQLTKQQQPRSISPPADHSPQTKTHTNTHTNTQYNTHPNTHPNAHSNIVVHSSQQLSPASTASSPRPSQLQQPHNRSTVHKSSTQPSPTSNYTFTTTTTPTPTSIVYAATLPPTPSGGGLSTSPLSTASSTQLLQLQLISPLTHLIGYQTYLVEQWVPDRQHTVKSITVYTGDKRHQVCTSLIYICM